AIAIALFRRGDNRGIDDLAAHRQEPGRGQCRIEPIEENLDSRFTSNPRLRQHFAERPDRVRIRHRVTQPQAEKAHERQSVPDQVLGMSGAWAYERDQLEKLLAPGFYISDTAVPIPRVIAVPLYFAICIPIAYWLLAFIETGVARFAIRRGKTLSKSK